MTGYEEVLTDPVVLRADRHHDGPANRQHGHQPRRHRERFVGRPRSPASSCATRARALRTTGPTETLDAYLARHGIVGISGIDTRALTRHLRDHGSQNGAIGTDSPDALVRKAREAPSMAGLDLVKRVTPKEPYAFTESSGALEHPARRAPPSVTWSPSTSG